MTVMHVKKVERGALREKCVLHFAFDQLFDGDGLHFCED